MIPTPTLGGLDQTTAFAAAASTLTQPTQFSGFFDSG